MCSNQDSKDFEFLFRSLKNAAQTYVDCDYNPDVLIADSAPEITNGFTAVFGEPRKRINCWFHMLKNCDEQLRSVNSETRGEIRNDITKLQVFPFDDGIEKAFQLFDSKWRKLKNKAVDVFLDYFSKNWTRD